MRPRAIAVWVWMLASGVASAQGPDISRVSVDPGTAQANGASQSPSISADGRYVAFASDAFNLLAGDTNNLSDIYIKDRQTGAVARASVKTDGSQATGESRSPSLSANGRYVAFVSYAPLVAEDTRTLSLIHISEPTRPY